jgi:hypothetical protein
MIKVVVVSMMALGQKCSEKEDLIFEKRINDAVAELDDADFIVIDVNFTESVRGRTAYLRYRDDTSLWKGNKGNLKAIKFQIPKSGRAVSPFLEA